MARTLWGIVRRDRRFARPVAVSVELDAAPPAPAQDMLILLVSGLERLFLGMRPYWGEENGPLHVSMIRADADRLLRTLPALLRGRPSRHAGVTAGYQSHNVERIRLMLDGLYTLDGKFPLAAPTGR
jgi:hypothetical protein